MDRIYAPWRIEWVERDRDPIDGCPFCVLPERGDDVDARIVARGEHNFVLLNNAPYNPGHAMVIPYGHVAEWGALGDDVMLEHGRLKAATIAALESASGPDGVNTGMNLGGSAAGGSIDDHLHTHVVPRWDGDTNFMPVVSDTKVIVEAVDRTYEHLHAAFGELEAAVTVPSIDGDDDRSSDDDATDAVDAADAPADTADAADATDAADADGTAGAVRLSF
ncbi:HIT domain-containing protein [haloarchaeon 3A1-DGR]|nr:HIT domain-containing protein [haloarchaeon 3A1-DGR]